MKNSSRKSNGFTVIEVIISFTIGVMLIFTVYSMVLSAMKLNKKSGVKQDASYVGQQILEDLRSTDVYKVLSGNSESGYKLKFDGIELSGKSKEKFSVTNYNLSNSDFTDNDDRDFLKGYTADIKVEKNKSGIGAGQQVSGTASVNEYTVYVSGKGEKAFLDDGKNNHQHLNLNESEHIQNCFEIIVNIEKQSSKKTISIGNFSKEFSSDDEIRLNIDFSNYDFDFSDEDKNPEFEIIINNEDDKDLNLCLQKPNTLKKQIMTTTDIRHGNCKIFDNRVSSDTPYDKGNLYDVALTIKKDGKSVFEQKLSQNIGIYELDNTN